MEIIVIFKLMGHHNRFTFSMRFHNGFDSLLVTCIDNDIKDLKRVNGTYYDLRFGLVKQIPELTLELTASQNIGSQPIGDSHFIPQWHRNNDGLIRNIVV